MAAQPDPPAGSARRIAQHLSALVGRLMPCGGWTAGERHADAEPIGTGRRRPYDESTLRKRARELAQHGGTDLMARAVEASVEQAVAASATKAVAYTDIFDQVYWTKKPAYAAPIGSRGNRLLAATYFGMTFVQADAGAPLAYCASWHKPASPLQDGLEALHAATRRATWLSANIRRHIWDRGGSGRPTLQWALAHRIPYLTVTKGSTRWTRYRRPPKVHTRSRVPVFVRRDVAVRRGCPKGATAEEVIFPARPSKGRASTKALRYRTGVPLPKDDLRQLDRVYKSRWPCNENPIKALVAVGFDRNLDRGLTLTSSRGTDGRLARVQKREQVLRDKIAAFSPPTIPKLIRGARRLLHEKVACAQQRAFIAAIPNEKGARMDTGAELFCKNLMLLAYNFLALLLTRSPIDEVRTMTPARVHELLLGCNLLSTEDPSTHRTTLWVEPLPSPSERSLQEELVRLFNGKSLSVRGRHLSLRIGAPDDQAHQLRPAGLPQALLVSE
jgi:hypothetical protein